MRREDSGTRRVDDSLGFYRRVRGRVVSALQSRVETPARRVAPLAPLAAAHRVRRRLRPSRYTDAPPFRLRWVPPDSIQQSLLESAPQVPQWGRVVDGDWEEASEPFDERAVPRGIEQRYGEGREWRETALFDAFREQLARFGNAWGHTDLDGFTERCRRIDRLHDAIQTSGYRRQDQLHGPDGYATTARLAEINVDIGQEGDIYWRAYGQHRLALAKLLDVDSVPVVVHRRHARWQAVRDAVRQGDPVPDGFSSVRIENHPDLGDHSGGTDGAGGTGGSGGSDEKSADSGSNETGSEDGASERRTEDGSNQIAGRANSDPHTSGGDRVDGGDEADAGRIDR